MSADEAHPVTPETLHRIHAAHDIQGTGWRVDIQRMTWRCEAAEGEVAKSVRKAAAARIAVCWNVLEGIPTEALLSGAVRKFYEAGRQLADLIEAGCKAEVLTADTLLPLVDEMRKADAALEFDRVDCTCVDHKKPKRKKNQGGAALPARIR